MKKILTQFEKLYDFRESFKKVFIACNFIFLRTMYLKFQI